VTVKAGEVAALVRAIRRSFQLLKTVSDDRLLDLELTASLRAILEFIDEHGPHSVPQIASAKFVKRQSVQALVDQLAACGFIEAVANPAHKRSPLFAMTARGETLFGEVRSRDAQLMAEAADWLKSADVAGAVATLDRLEDFLRALAGLARDCPCQTAEAA
jgi:DNA-binding MarR family transcriptional regulator